MTNINYQYIENNENNENIYIEPIHSEINYINNPFNNQITNQLNGLFINQNYFDNSYDIYKKKVNKEFKDYIINIFKDHINYIFKGQFILKLKKICNIKNIFIKIFNPKISLINNLNYNIHKNQISILIDNFMLVMKNKGYHYFEFDNYEYILYELLNNNIVNIDNNYMYFIKIYNKKNNIDYTNKKSTWLFHKDTMYEYIY